MSSPRTETCHSFCLPPAEEQALQTWLDAAPGRSVNGITRSLLRTFLAQDEGESGVGR